MAVIRLDSDERRKAIVAAAVPLFAQWVCWHDDQGARRGAGISEALLLRHFPSKSHLCGEILRLACEGDPALERLEAIRTRLLRCARNDDTRKNSALTTVVSLPAVPDGPHDRRKRRLERDIVQSPDRGG